MNNGADRLNDFITPKKEGRAVSADSKGNVLSPTNTEEVKVRSMSSPFKERDNLMCRFCGGRYCNKENWISAESDKQRYLKGLNSSLIWNKLIASQRPSTRLIREHDIIG